MVSFGDKRAYRASSVYLYLEDNKTVLVIAHRMRTVAGADKIVVLADGVVAEQGKPSELYKKNGIYARMVDLQSASGKWKIKYCAVLRRKSDLKPGRNFQLLFSK